MKNRPHELSDLRQVLEKPNPIVYAWHRNDLKYFMKRHGFHVSFMETGDKIVTTIVGKGYKETHIARNYVLSLKRILKVYETRCENKPIRQ